MGPDLDLKRFIIRPDHRRVKRFIHSIARGRDIVFEPSGHRLVQRVYSTQSGVAFLHGIDENTKSNEIEDFIKVSAANDHLLVNRPIVFRSPHHLCTDVVILKPCLQLLRHSGDIFIALRRTIGHQPNDFLVLLGVQNSEGEVF